MTFMKTTQGDYRVILNGKMIVGTIRKIAKVYRGTSVQWEAWYAGKYLGTFDTRNEAGQHLCSHGDVKS